MQRTRRYSPIVLLLLVVVSACGGSEASTSTESKTAAPAKPPLVQKVEVADWCKEHGVPESVCTRCNEGLIPDFQAKGDWCKEHSLPESQCIACHPELEATFKAMAPKSSG